MSQLIYYGAGKYARNCYNRWYSCGDRPVCFVDKNPELHHTNFISASGMSLEILPLVEAIARYPDYELMITVAGFNAEGVHQYLLEVGTPEDRITLPSLTKSMPEPRCKTGKNTYSSGYVSDRYSTIGSFCSIAANVYIGVTCHPTNWLSTSNFQYSSRPDLHDIHVADDNVKTFPWTRPVHVGNDCWLGTGVIIFDGVTVGDGAIIGANAVVTKDIPPYAIAVGVPAKVIRYRFDDETVQSLLELKWWDLDDEIIAQLPFDDIHLCIEQLRVIRGEDVRCES